MPSPEEIRDAVLREIEAAFDGVSRRGGVSLHEADVINDYGTPAERETARSLDAETRWQDVPAGDIRTYHWILSSLDPIGYRYYLPAYMTWSLMNLRSPRDTTSIDTTIFSLTRREDETYEAWELDRFKLFTPGQAKAICNFLGYVGAHGSFGRRAEVALHRYWAAYCDARA